MSFRRPSCRKATSAHSLVQARRIPYHRIVRLLNIALLALVLIVLATVQSALAYFAPRFLTLGDAFDDWPSFSPDGRTVAFARSASLGKDWPDWTLTLIPAKGGSAHELARLPVAATRPS